MHLFLKVKTAMEEWFVIVNPVSGHGRCVREWPRIEALLRKAGFDYTFNFSSSKYEAIDLAYSAVRMGFRKIIVVGGDGTMHEVLNGLYRQQEVPMSDIVVGVIPVGTQVEVLAVQGVKLIVHTVPHA